MPVNSNVGIFKKQSMSKNGFITIIVLILLCVAGIIYTYKEQAIQYKASHFVSRPKQDLLKIEPEKVIPYVPRSITFLISKESFFSVSLNHEIIPVKISELTEGDKIYNSFTIDQLQKFDVLKVIDSETSELLFQECNFSKRDEQSRVYL